MVSIFDQRLELAMVVHDALANGHIAGPASFVRNQIFKVHVGKKAAHVVVAVGVGNFVQIHTVGRIPVSAQPGRVDFAEHPPQFLPLADVARRFVFKQQYDLVLFRQSHGFFQSLHDVRIRLCGILHTPIAEDSNLVGAEKPGDLKRLVQRLFRVLLRQLGLEEAAFIVRNWGNFRQIPFIKRRADVGYLKVMLVDDLLGVFELRLRQAHNVLAADSTQFTVGKRVARDKLQGLVEVLGNLIGNDPELKRYRSLSRRLRTQRSSRSQCA